MTGLKTLLPSRLDDLLFQVFTPEFKQPRSDCAVIMFSGRKELPTNKAHAGESSVIICRNSSNSRVPL
jgi:hypothetical protein